MLSQQEYSLGKDEGAYVWIFISKGQIQTLILLLPHLTPVREAGMCDSKRIIPWAPELQCHSHYSSALNIPLDEAKTGTTIFEVTPRCLRYMLPLSQCCQETLSKLCKKEVTYSMDKGPFVLIFTEKEKLNHLCA